MLWLGKGILHDLILLENQLPFFVLDGLYTYVGFGDSSSLSPHQEGQQIKEHKGDQNNEDTPFLKLSHHYFACYDPQQKSDDEKVKGEPIGKEVKHFTDLLRYLFYSRDMEPLMIDEEKWLDSSKNTKTEKSGTPFCATNLDDAGLKFEVKCNKHLLGITLPGCLERFPCFSFSCLFACLPCLICLICFLSLHAFLGASDTLCISSKSHNFS
jgi:hypothetical protein